MKEDVSKAIIEFVKYITKKFKKEAGYNIKQAGKSKNYIRIADDDSALLFIDKTNGDIYGANTWTKPSKKAGNVTDKNSYKNADAAGKWIWNK